MQAEVFSENELLDWRKKLEMRKSQVLKNEKALRERALKDLSQNQTGEISHLRLHPADLASDNAEVETLGTLSKRQVKKVQEIEDALERIDKGNYGICQGCGEPISVERLSVIPETRYCKTCGSESKMQIQKMIETRESTLPVLVADIMQRNPIVINQKESLDTALGLIADNKIRHLPVINDFRDLQGIISDRDLLGVVLRIRPGERARKIENFWNSNKVVNYMTKYPETVTPDSKLVEAGQIMLDNKISCLPVVEGTKVVGILTESDFVKVYCGYVK